MKMKQFLAGVLSVAMALTYAPVSTLPVFAADESAADTSAVEASFTYSISEDESSITYSNINLTDPNSYDVSSTADFFASTSAYNNIAFDIVLKYQSEDDLTTTADALITLADDDGNYLTARYTPHFGTSSGNAVIATSCNGRNCSGTGWTSAAMTIGAAKYYKLSVAINSSGRLYYQGGSSPNIAEAGTVQGDKTRITASPIFKSEGWTPTKVFIGKTAVSMGLTDNSNGTSIEDLPTTATIAYIKVTKNLTTIGSSGDKGVSTHATVSSVSAAALTTAKEKTTTLIESNYTEKSWSKLTDALDAADSAATDAEIWNAISDLSEAYEGLDTDLFGELTGILTEAKNLQSLGSSPFTSGFEALESAIALAEACDVNTDNATIGNAVSALDTAIDALVFADKIYTDVSVGDEVYNEADEPFYSHMKSLTFTMVFKYNNDPGSFNKYCPLITFSDNNEKWVTLYYNASDGTGNNANAHIAFGYPSSGADTFTANIADNGGARTDSITRIADTDYHKLTFTFKDEVARVKLDGKTTMGLSDGEHSWSSSLIQLMQETAWTSVTIGKNSSNATGTFAGYETTFPECTINYVQISSEGCDSTGIAAVNTAVNQNIQDSYKAWTSLQESNYTSESYSTYNEALTSCTEKTTDWEMLNAIDTLKTAAENLVGTEHFTSSSVTLDGNIGLNILTDRTDEDGVTVKFTKGEGDTLTEVPGTPVEYTGDDGNKTNYYTFELPAKEMADEVTATMTDAVGNEISTVTLSVKNYAEKLLKISTSYEEKALVKAMLNYGAAAQNEFNYNTSNLANSGLLDEDKTVTAIGEDLSSSCGNLGLSSALSEDQKASYVGFSLVLNSETALKLYFAADTKVTVKQGDTVLTEANGEVETGTASGGQTWIKIKNIAANELDNAYTVMVGEGDNATEYGTWSALTYCYKQKDSDDENMKNLVNALYGYSQAAEVYVASQSQTAGTTE